MRYLITFSYDGTNYNGYQKQPNGNTIQNNIEDALFKINSNNSIKLHATGRTDKGVHAVNQKAHFDFIDTNENKLKKSLNQLTNSDIFIKDIKKVDKEFHARYCCKKKEYIYKINLGEYNPFDRNLIYQYNKPLDIKKINKNTKYLIGKHDFRSFTKKDEYTNYERTIYKINLNVENNILTISFLGNGFLRYMVRNIVGMLIKIGEGKDYDIEGILSSKEKIKVGVAANPCGLYLNNIWY